MRPVSIYLSITIIIANVAENMTYLPTRNATPPFRAPSAHTSVVRQVFGASCDVQANVNPSRPDEKVAIMAEDFSPRLRDLRAGGLAIIVAAVVLGAAIAWGLTAVGAGVAARAADGVTVTGSARTEVRADRAVWRIHAYAQADQISGAINDVESSLAAVREFLANGGVTDDNITTEGLSTQVNYRWTDQGMTSEIMSYSASQTLTVRSEDVDLIDRLNRTFGDVLRTGVNVSNYQPEFLISDLAALRPELQAQAVTDAITRANAMLAVVGNEITSIATVRAGPLQVSTSDSVDVSDYGMYDTSTIDKAVTATVTITFKTG